MKTITSERVSLLLLENIQSIKVYFAKESKAWIPTEEQRELISHQLHHYNITIKILSFDLFLKKILSRQLDS